MAANLPNACEARIIAEAAAAAAAVLAKALEPGSNDGGEEGAVIRRHVICRPFPPLTSQVLDKVLSSNTAEQPGTDAARTDSEVEEGSSSPAKSCIRKSSCSTLRRRGNKKEAGGDVARNGSASKTKSRGGGGKKGDGSGGPGRKSLGGSDALAAAAETPEQPPKKRPRLPVSAPGESPVGKAARNSPRQNVGPPQADAGSGSVGVTKKSPFDEFLHRPWSDGFKSGPNKRGHSLRLDEQTGRVCCEACSKSYDMRNERCVEKHLGDWNHLARLRLYIQKHNARRKKEERKMQLERKKLERKNDRKRKRKEHVVPLLATKTGRRTKPPQRLTVGEDGGFVEEHSNASSGGEDDKNATGNDCGSETEASRNPRAARTGMALSPTNRRRLPTRVTFVGPNNGTGNEKDASAITVPLTPDAKGAEKAAAAMGGSPGKLQLTGNATVEDTVVGNETESTKVGTGSQNEEDCASEVDDVDLELEPLPDPLPESSPKCRPRPRPTEEESDEDCSPASDNDSDEDYVPEKEKTGRRKPRGPYKPRATHRTFSERMAELRQFKELNGHLRVPNKGHELSDWVKRMRNLWTRSRKVGGAETISDEDKAKLKELKEVGFIFDPVLDERIEQLLEYKRTHGGNMKIPQSYPVIGPWAYRMRLDYGRMRRGLRTQFLDWDRIQRLTDIGFLFRHSEVEPKSFSEWVKILKAFKEEHGHADVPVKEGRLFTWVSRMRLYYRKRKQAEAEVEEKNKMDPRKYCWLTLEQIKELDELGFEWRADYRAPKKLTTENWSWDRYLEEFKKYKAAHGHPYVSRCDPHYRKLGTWVAHQRQRYKDMKKGIHGCNKHPPLTAEQALKLTEAGFGWDASHIRRTPKSSAEVEMVRGEDVEKDEDVGGEEQDLSTGRDY